MFLLFSLDVVFLIFFFFFSILYKLWGHEDIFSMHLEVFFFFFFCNNSCIGCLCDNSKQIYYLLFECIDGLFMDVLLKNELIY